jgi:hypothetical protein
MCPWQQQRRTSPTWPWRQATWHPAHRCALAQSCMDGADAQTQMDASKACLCVFCLSACLLVCRMYVHAYVCILSGLLCVSASSACQGVVGTTVSMMPCSVLEICDKGGVFPRPGSLKSQQEKIRFKRLLSPHRAHYLYPANTTIFY